MARLLAGTIFDRPPLCERCGQPEDTCPCPKLPPGHKPPEKQTAKLAVEKRGKGKKVTVVRGLLASANDLPALLAALKGAVGAGGSVEGDTLEVQGEQIERVRQFLTGKGYKVK